LAFQRLKGNHLFAAAVCADALFQQPFVRQRIEHLQRLLTGVVPQLYDHQLSHDRDRIWKSAIAQYRAGKRPCLQQAEQALSDQRNQGFRSENIYLSAVEERCLGKLKARSSGFVTRYALDESGVCEGRPAGQREMRQMAQCLRELGFVQERNATKDPLLGRTRKWHWPGTGDTGAAR